jgi:hypothetical protein
MNSTYFLVKQVSSFHTHKKNNKCFTLFNWKNANPISQVMGYVIKGQLFLHDIFLSKGITPLNFEQRTNNCISLCKAPKNRAGKCDCTSSCYMITKIMLQNVKFCRNMWFFYLVSSKSSLFHVLWPNIFWCITAINKGSTTHLNINKQLWTSPFTLKFLATITMVNVNLASNWSCPFTNHNLNISSN